jgi:rubrerythrin
MRIKSVFIVTLALLTPLAFPVSAQASATTLQNMETAYNGESNAHERYLAFAMQADAEDFGEVASLFRAAARAEQIHATNHAAVIKQLGGVPEAKVEAPNVESTRENLQTAIAGETYERDTMYPEFIKQAKLDGDPDAVKSLNLAKTAEAEHERLYTAALADLDGLKGSKSVAFLVCPKCGFTTHDTNFTKCPSCFTPKERFEKVV